MGRQFYVAKGKEKFGPYSRQQIIDGIDSKIFLQDDLVWVEGMENWAKLKKVSLFKPHFEGEIAKQTALPDKNNSPEKTLSTPFQSERVFSRGENNNSKVIDESKLVQLSSDGKVLGEFSKNDIINGLKSGLILPTSYVWQSGWKSWELISNFDNFCKINDGVSDNVFGDEVFFNKKVTGNNFRSNILKRVFNFSIKIMSVVFVIIFFALILFYLNGNNNKVLNFLNSRRSIATPGICYLDDWVDNSFIKTKVGKPLDVWPVDTDDSSWKHFIKASADKREVYPVIREGYGEHLAKKNRLVDPNIDYGISLDFGVNPGPDQKNGLKWISHLKNLVMIEISGVSATPDLLNGIASLPKIKAVKFTTRPGVSGNDIFYSNCFPELKKITYLEFLSINDLKFEDKNLKGFPYLPKLKSLNLYRTNISDMSIESINLLKNLEYLDLYFTDISNSGLSALDLKKLKKLRLSDKYEKDVLDSFKKRFPNCEVIQISSYQDRKITIKNILEAAERMK